MKKQRATITIIVLCSIFFMLLGSQLALAGGGKIAFSKLIDGKWQIVVTDENGQNLINLSNNNVNDSEPSWSFDGRHIAFVSNRDLGSPYSSLVYIMDADGSNQRLAVKKNRDVDIQEHCPSFSPDGKKLVITRATADWNKQHNEFIYQYKIYTIDIDSSNEKYLTDGAYAKWSPDGKKIVFNPFKDDFINGDIVTMYTDGKNQVEITNDNRDVEPSWSLDGKYIAFMRRNENSNIYEVYKMDSDGNNIVRLTNGNPSWSRGPSWSPDRKYIVFWDMVSNATVATMWKIYKVSADGGDSIPISEGGCMEPSWFDPAYASFAVDPSDKYTATWGWIKNR